MKGAQARSFFSKAILAQLTLAALEGAILFSALPLEDSKGQ